MVRGTLFYVLYLPTLDIAYYKPLKEVIRLMNIELIGMHKTLVVFLYSLSVHFYSAFLISTLISWSAFYMNLAFIT